jgi:hypothetical protein
MAYVVGSIDLSAQGCLTKSLPLTRQSNGRLCVVFGAHDRWSRLHGRLADNLAFRSLSRIDPLMLGVEQHQNAEQM